jgi:rubredoxin
MIRYVCGGCFFTYDPEEGLPDMGIKPGTSFEDLPDDWLCPDCGLPKEEFRKYEE